MDKSELARLKELAEKATPGPWKLTAYFSSDEQEANCLFIAAANPKTVLELIDQVEYLQVLKEEREEYYRQFDKLANLLGVFSETDPGKPETFAVFIREFTRLK